MIVSGAVCRTVACSGIGLLTISIDSASIPGVQEAISRINIDEAEWQAREMLTFTRTSEVEEYLAELRKG